jgi:hypothetical protein
MVFPLGHGVPVTELPEGLHGVHRRNELICQLGLPHVRMLLRDGRLVRYSRNVLIDRRHVLKLATRAAAALLFVGPRAALTLHTAAVLYGCTAADDGSIHLLVDYDRWVPRRPGLALRHGIYDEDDVLVLDGLRTLALEIVIAEMLCTAPGPVALACADQALAGLDVPLRKVFRREVARRIRGRADIRGTRRGQMLFNLASGVPESPAESHLLLVLFDAGLPIPVPQYRVLDLAGRERYRLDFAWEEPRVALEYDGYEAHEGREAQDAGREADLRSRGWIVIRAAAPDLRDPTRLVTAVRTAFAKRRYAA